MLIRKRLGQSTAEYAIVIALVIAAAMAMQTYVKRGIQAKIKAASDHQLAEYGLGNATTQYEPYYAQHNITTTSTSTETVGTETGGKVKRELIGEGEKTTREAGVSGQEAETVLGTNNPD